jgi:hypothetical protein
MLLGNPVKETEDGVLGKERGMSLDSLFWNIVGDSS